MKKEVNENQEGEIFHFSSRNQRLSMTVIEGVAWVKSVDPVDLNPLADYIDPAALDVIFANTECGSLSFEMEDLSVLVQSDGEVLVSWTEE